MKIKVKLQIVGALSYFLILAILIFLGLEDRLESFFTISLMALFIWMADKIIRTISGPWSKFIHKNQEKRAQNSQIPTEEIKQKDEQKLNQIKKLFRKTLIIFIAGSWIVGAGIFLWFILRM